MGLALDSRRGREQNQSIVEQCRVNFRRASPSTPHSSRLCSLSRMAEHAELNFNCFTLRPFASCSGSILLSFDICYSQQAVVYFYWWQFCLLILLDVRFWEIKKRITWRNKELVNLCNIIGFIRRWRICRLIISDGFSHRHGEVRPTCPSCLHVGTPKVHTGTSGWAVSTGHRPGIVSFWFLSWFQ